MTEMKRNLEEYYKKIKEKQNSENFFWREKNIWPTCLEIKKEIKDLIKREDVIGIGYGPKSLNLKDLDIPEVKILVKGEFTKDKKIKQFSEIDKKRLDLPKEIVGIKTEIYPKFCKISSTSQCPGMDPVRHDVLRPGQNIGGLERNRCGTLGMKAWDNCIPEDGVVDEYFLTCYHQFEPVGLEIYQPGWPQNYYWQNEIGEVAKTYDSVESGGLCEVSLIRINGSRDLENLPISRSMPYDAEFFTSVNVNSASYLEYNGIPSLYAKGIIAYAFIQVNVYDDYEDNFYSLEMQYAIEPENSGDEISLGGVSGAVYYDNVGTAIAINSATAIGTTRNTAIASGLNIPGLSHNVFNKLKISPFPPRNDCINSW